MGRGLALTALLGALAVLASCAQEDDAPTSTLSRTTPIATGTASSSSPTATSAIPTRTPTPGLDDLGCTLGPDGDKCRLLATYTPVPTPTVAPPDAYHPRDTRTGVPEVDAVIDAVLSKDARALADTVAFLTYPCEAPSSTAGSRQALACADGQPVGTPLTGIWVSHVEGGLWPGERDGDREKLIPMFESTLIQRDQQLHSVYALDGTEPGEERLRPDYIVTFVSWDAQSGPWYDNLVLSEGGLVAIRFAFPPFDRPIWENPGAPGWLLPRAR